MAKCKCVKNYVQEKSGRVYEENKYYDYDFISSIGDRPSFFRVYYEDESFEKIEVKDFKEHFKRF